MTIKSDFEKLWKEGAAKLHRPGETISPHLETMKPKRGRPRTVPTVSEEIKTRVRRAGYRVTKRSDGYVVVGPLDGPAYSIKITYPNAYQGWRAAHWRAFKEWI